jgi:hypothetical protein
VCILDQAGETRWHRHMPATPEALLKAIAPYRAQRVMAAECMVTWDWRADLCAEHRIPVVLGQALSMQAIQGGQATNDPLDAHQMAVRLRGGMLPQAYVYPAERRATRDLRRRRLPLARTRGERFAPRQHTNSQDHRPALGTTIAYKPNRDGGAERWGAPAVPKRIAVDRARIGSDEARLRDVDRTLVNTAKHHEAHPLSRLQPGPGIGTRLRLVRRYEIPPLDRCPRVQDFASYWRLVTWAKDAAGQRSGTSGTTIGHAHRQGAFSEAAVWCWRAHPAGQTLLARVAQTPRTGKALTSLAHPWARAVSDMCKHQTAVAMHKFLNGSGRGGGELDASRDDQGLPLTRYARHSPHACLTARR